MRVHVNLAEPRLAHKVTERFDTFCQISEELVAAEFVTDEVRLDLDALARAAQGYVLINEAYKRIWLNYEPGADGTEPPKIAAIAALCFSHFRPFRIADVTQPVLHVESLEANCTLSMEFAASVLGDDFGTLRPMMQKRLFDCLDRTYLFSLKEFTDDQRAERYEYIYNVDISGDLVLINLLTLFFETFWTPPAD